MIYLLLLLLAGCAHPALDGEIPPKQVEAAEWESRKLQCEMQPGGKWWTFSCPTGVCGMCVRVWEIRR